MVDAQAALIRFDGLDDTPVWLTGIPTEGWTDNKRLPAFASIVLGTKSYASKSGQRTIYHFRAVSLTKEIAAANEKINSFKMEVRK